MKFTTEQHMIAGAVAVIGVIITMGCLKPDLAPYAVGTVGILLAAFGGILEGSIKNE